MKEKAMVIENLTKKLEDVTAVDNPNLEIQKGELFGLLGPNGAWKTTVTKISATPCFLRQFLLEYALFPLRKTDNPPKC
jgi:ABC-type branched-subunit amino acid transport system ATPase component